MADGAAAAAGEPPAAPPRSQLSDFTILRELGRGTFGAVFLARRAQDGQLYALKQVQLSNRSAREQMEAVQEAKLLASLESPHVIKYYDSFLHEGCLFICMEYAPGGSLHAAIRAMPRPLPEEAIWRVLLQVALALHHMHGRRMLHRDVKTLNIFLSGPLDQAGQPPAIKLGDVGVSKVLEEGRNHASTFLGTPLYLSPEMCNELPYDAKSDMWALGVLLYECSMRRHPFEAKSQPSLILKILRGRYDPMLGLSAELTGIINRLLSQSPARRPSAERLLSLPSVRAKAAELGIELPPIQLPLAPPAGSPGPAAELGEGRRLTAAHGAKAGAKVALPAAPLARPLRRASCPDGDPEGGPVQQPPGRRVTVQERRKPPLPPAAVPHRRRTVQAGAVAEQALSPPRQPRPAAPAVVAARVQPLLGSLEGADEAIAHVPAAGGAAPEAGQAQQRQGGGIAGGEAKPPAVKVTHFSLEQHMIGLSAATRQWLQQRGASPGDAGDGFVQLEVQRSAKSDSNLLAWGGERATVSAAPCLAADAADELAADEAATIAAQLRHRCVALLGTEARCAELLALAKAAAAAEQGSDSGGSGRSRGGGSRGGGSDARASPSMASLGEAVYAFTGSAGRAGEVMFLLMRLLAAEG